MLHDLQKESRDISKKTINKAQIASHSDLLADDERRPLLDLAQIPLSQEISYNQALIIEREQGIEDVQEALHEIQHLFKDIGTLVSEQQFGLDNIASNVNLVAENSHHAREELRIAEDYRRNRPLVNCCLFVFSILIVTALLVFIISV